jgi:hypothetical protein
MLKKRQLLLKVTGKNLQECFERNVKAKKVAQIGRQIGSDIHILLLTKNLSLLCAEVQTRRVT